MKGKNKTQQNACRELRIELRGRVQGVNMRRNLAKEARSLELAGYVMNRSDGSVSVLAQGSQDGLEDLLSWAQKAVFPAKVIGMTYEWTEPERDYEGFTIEKNDHFVKDQAKSFYNLGKGILNTSKIDNIPRHVVIIADGNRRWARSHGWKPWVGHDMASKYDRLKKIFDECKGVGVKYLSLWVWSTENWDRAEEEQEEIFNIFRNRITQARDDFMKERIRFRHIGRKDRLSKDIVEGLTELEEQTKSHRGLNFQLCMDYGGRDEIVRAVNGMIKDGVKDVTEEMFSKYLDTSDVPDPDLIIRTSGEQRTSGIMPYQAAYAELYFTKIPFPEFGAEEFMQALAEYSGRTRRFGGTSQADLKDVDIDSLEDPSKRVALNAEVK